MMLEVMLECMLEGVLEVKRAEGKLLLLPGSYSNHRGNPMDQADSIHTTVALNFIVAMTLALGGTFIIAACCL
jgi:hypothetical protein